MKKNVLVFVAAVLIVGGSLVVYSETPSGFHHGPQWVYAGQIAGEAAAVREAVIKMVATGLSPEDITFTGANSSDDVFGGGSLDIKNNFVASPGMHCYPRDCSGWELPPKALLPIPPPAVCSPCSGWKFLPAAKKDYGWYVYGVDTPATDIIAYISGLSPQVCSELQISLGFKSPIPPKQAGTPFDPDKPGVYSAKGSTTTIKSEDNTLDGQPYACFDNHVGSGASNFSFYFVLHAQ